LALVIIDTDSVAGVCLLRLNRPEKLNALNKALVIELHTAILAANRHSAVGCIVLTGSGHRAFSAGADIDEEKSLSAELAYAHMLWGQSVLRDLANGKPSIAALNGMTLGGGLELALACDIRVAADSAELALPEAAMGTVPAWGGLPRLLALVGPSNARMIAFSGRRYSATKGQSLGLISEVYAGDVLLAQALELAREISHQPSEAIGQMKSLLQQTQAQAQSALDRLDEAQARAAESLWGTPARAAAVQGFVTRPRSSRL
jgi:enoyl-CoA hydratase/carnithine racemase